MTREALTKETTTATHQTRIILIELARHMLDGRQFGNVFLGVPVRRYWAVLRLLLATQRCKLLRQGPTGPRGRQMYSCAISNEASSATTETAENWWWGFCLLMTVKCSLEYENPEDKDIIFYVNSFIAAAPVVILSTVSHRMTNNMCSRISFVIRICL